MTHPIPSYVYKPLETNTKYDLKIIFYLLAIFYIQKSGVGKIFFFHVFERSLFCVYLFDQKYSKNQG